MRSMMSGLAALALLAGAVVTEDVAFAQSNGAPPKTVFQGRKPAALAQAPQAPQAPQVPQAATPPAAAPPPAPAAAPPKAAATPTPAPAQPAAPAPVAKQATRGPEQEYRECLNLWDAATHMTRAEWAATCRRIQNRLNDITAKAAQLNAPVRRRVR